MDESPISRRKFLRTAATAASAGLLAACGGAAAVPAPAPTSVPATAAPAPTLPPAPTAVPPTAAPTVAAAEPTAVALGPTKQLSGEIVISNWHIGGGQPSELAQQMLTEAYNQYQPDVKIIWETQVGGEYGTWLGTQLAAGTPRPDIVSVNYQPTYDKYVDVINYVDAVNPYTGRKWNEDFDFEFYGAGATNWTFFATQQVQVPWFYNKTLFDKAGVTKAPDTYDEWMDACDNILTKTGVSPLAMHYNNLLQWMAEVYFDQYHRDWVDKARAQPGDWNYNPAKDDAFVYDPDDPDINKKATFSIQRLLKGLKEGTLSYDTEEMTALMTNFARLGPYVNKDFWVGVPRYPLFLQQQAAMYPDLTTAFWTLDRDLKQMSDARREALKLDADTKIESFEYGVFQYPSMTGPLVKGKARAVESIAGEYLGAIDKNAQQTELNVDFLMFWMSKAGYQPWVDGFAESDLWTPSGKMLIRDIEVPEKYATVIDSIKPVGNAETDPNPFLTFLGGFGTLWQRESQEMVKQVMDGTMNPADFGKQYQSLITEKYWSDILAARQLTEEAIMNPQLEPKR